MIVAGFGFRASASVESLLDAYARATAKEAAGALATISDKAESAVFKELAQTLSLPVHHVAPDAVSGFETPTESAYSQAARGTGSVAEATALAAVGAGAELIQPRVVSHDRLATCALAWCCGEGERK